MNLHVRILFMETRIIISYGFLSVWLSDRTDILIANEYATHVFVWVSHTTHTLFDKETLSSLVYDITSVGILYKHEMGKMCNPKQAKSNELLIHEHIFRLVMQTSGGEKGGCTIRFISEIHESDRGTYILHVDLKTLETSSRCAHSIFWAFYLWAGTERKTLRNH